MLILKLKYYTTKLFMSVDDAFKDTNRRYKQSFERIEHSIIESILHEQLDSCENFIVNFERLYPNQVNLITTLYLLLDYKRKELLEQA